MTDAERLHALAMNGRFLVEECMLFNRVSRQLEAITISEADAKRIAAIDEVLIVQLAGLDFKNTSMITMGGTEYQKWSRACFNAIGHLIAQDLLPKAEVTDGQ